MSNDEIYLDEIQCPLCDKDTYCDFWDIKVHPDIIHHNRVKCDDCGREFIIKTQLIVTVEKL